MKKPANVDVYISENSQWESGLVHLRQLILSTNLTETIKWAFPCYTWNKKNIVGLAAFKDYFGLWFHQGATLLDEMGMLNNAQEGKTVAMRQWRFQSERDIVDELVLAYIEEAIHNQKTGNIIKVVRSKKLLVIPEALQTFLDQDTTLAYHFSQFRPSDQRDFAEHIANAKRMDTKQRRLEKIIPMILRDEALADKYRKK
ncbi:MAG: DUF1801 domain-containing protein [Bacteroidota bacterium]